MSVASDLNRVITGYHSAQEALNYAQAITMEMQLNQDADYTMVWTVAYSGKYPPVD